MFEAARCGIRLGSGPRRAVISSQTPSPSNRHGSGYWSAEARARGGSPMGSRYRFAFASLVLSGGLLVAGSGAGKDTELPPTTIRTGFDPKIDGLSFENSGDLENPDGNCFGMSLLAIQRFFDRRARGGAAEEPAEPRKVSTAAADILQEELVSYLQQHTSQRAMHEAKLDDPSNILASLARIATTGDPEIFTMTGRQGGHVAVIFGYVDGAVLLLDPNYPHRTIAWPFDYKRGFGAHPLSKSLGKGKDFYAVLESAGAEPVARFRQVAKELALLSEPEALRKASIPRYPSVSVSVASSNEKIALEGTIEGGPRRDANGEKVKKPTRVWLTVDGRPAAHANVRPDGSYRLMLPGGVVSSSTREVRVIATIDETQPNNQNAMETYRMFAGYVDVDPARILAVRTAGLAGALSGHD